MKNPPFNSLVWGSLTLALANRENPWKNESAAIYTYCGPGKGSSSLPTPSSNISRIQIAVKSLSKKNKCTAWPNMQPTNLECTISLEN